MNNGTEHAARTLDCPKCGSAMAPLSLEQVGFEYCSACEGVWFDGTRLPDGAPLENDKALLADVARTLKERQGDIQAFLDSAPFEMGIKDTEGRYLLINRHTEELYGRSNEDVQGKLPSDLFPAQDAQKMIAAQQRTLDTGEVSSTEAGDGEGRWFLATYFPIRDWQNQVTGLGGIGLDVTVRRQAELKIEQINTELEALVEERTQELRAAQEKLLKQTRLAMVGEITATVSHELRNPMATMRSSLFVLGGLVERGNDRLDRALARLERSLQRCDGIIDELLDFARTKEAVLKATMVDDWLSGVLNEYEGSGDLQIDRQLDADGACIQADHERLRRAVINVLENACHALLQQTQNPHPAPSVVVSTGIEDGRLFVSFIDNGVGMKKDVLDQCFEPLFSTKGFGTGLGLPAASRILQQHGGEITIDSEPGEGTTVVFSLPLAGMV